MVFVRDTGQGLAWQFKGAEAGRGFRDGGEHFGDSISGDGEGGGDDSTTMDDGDSRGGSANGYGYGKGWGDGCGGGCGPNIPGGWH